MKYFHKYAIWVFLIFAFAGCKDDEQEIIDVFPNEEWKQISDSVIPYGYRNIVSTELVADELFVMAENQFYFLDSTFMPLKNRSFLFENKISYQLPLSVKHNNHYLIFQRYRRYPVISIWDAKRPWEQVNFIVSLDEIDPNFDEMFHFSKPNEFNEFDVVYRRYKNESVSYIYSTFKINGTSGTSSPISIDKIKELELFSFESAKNANPKEMPKVFKFDDLSFISINGYIYRFKNEEFLDTNRYKFNNMFEHKGHLFAQSVRVRYYRDDLIRENELLKSMDKGKTWNYVGKGFDLAMHNIKSIGSFIIIQKSRNIALLDLEKNNRYRHLITH